jgi:hypothetical protein
MDPGLALSNLALGWHPLSRRVCDAYVAGLMDLPLGSVPRTCLLEWDALRKRMAAPRAPSREIAARLNTERACADELQWLARCTAFVLLNRFVRPRVDEEDSSSASVHDASALAAIEADELLVRCLASECDAKTYLKLTRCSTLGPPSEAGWTIPPFIDSSLCPVHANGVIAARRKHLAVAGWNAILQMATADEPLLARVHRAITSGVAPLEKMDVPPFAYRYWMRLGRLRDRSLDSSALRALLEIPGPRSPESYVDALFEVLGQVTWRVSWDVAMLEERRSALGI